VRLGPAIGLGGFAAHLLFAAGAATALYAGAAMLTRPDVKGALAHSTMAQMGFMLVQVALGAVAAAVVHLVGHAMYKAALFLGSGSAITAGRRRAAALPGRRLPRRSGRRPPSCCRWGALTAAVAVAGGLDAVGGPGAAVLLAFAWASGAQAVDGWLRTGPPAALGAALAGTAVAAAAYVGLLAGAKAFLAPSLPVVSGHRPVARGGAGARRGRRHGGADPRAHGGPAAATAYAWLLDAGAVVRDGRRRRRPRALRAPAVALGRPAEVVS
jgi:NADH:ubiquinone oxidoreductase subunit 5 (subunit L)/multisubunit Na+/H+ antiporter MnhA subunit